MGGIHSSELERARQERDSFVEKNLPVYKNVSQRKYSDNQLRGKLRNEYGTFNHLTSPNPKNSNSYIIETDWKKLKERVRNRSVDGKEFQKRLPLPSRSYSK
jgi:hypothetical protein